MEKNQVFLLSEVFCLSLAAYDSFIGGFFLHFTNCDISQAKNRFDLGEEFIPSLCHIVKN